MEAALKVLAQGRADAQAVALLLLDWREPLLFIILAAECVPLLGFAAPGLIVLVAAGFVAAGLDLAAAARLFATALAAIATADLALFALGRWGSARSARLARWIGPRAALGRELAGQPNRLLLFYQFPPYSRMFGPLMLGSSEIGWGRWLGLCGAGTLLFVLAFFGAGLAAANLATGLAGMISAAGTVALIFGFAFIAWAAAMARRLWRGRSRSR